MRFFALFALLFVCLFAYSAVADSQGSSSPDEAPELCACPRNLEPVCGSDAVTYPNRCEFQCAFKRQARQGRSIAIARDGNC